MKFFNLLYSEEKLSRIGCEKYVLEKAFFKELQF